MLCDVKSVNRLLQGHWFDLSRWGQTELQILTLDCVAYLFKAIKPIVSTTPPTPRATRMMINIDIPSKKNTRKQHINSCG